MRFRSVCAAAVALVCTSVGVAAPAAVAAPRGHLAIEVLSSRADLISGGVALVAVDVPAGAKASQVSVHVGDRNVTGEFAVRPNGRFEALVNGLVDGPNVVTATLPDGRGARITITNHPLGGPVLSGPQLPGWTCQTGAVDAKCDAPASFTYLYQSTDPSKAGLQPYDPSNPPTDVATTTTDNGMTVPFIVRVETGYQDRDQYSIATLFQPGQPWGPGRPSRSGTTSC